MERFVDHAAVYGAWMRAATAGVLAVSAASVPTLAALIVFGNDFVLTPAVLIRMFLVLTALPAVTAWLALRTAAARVAVGAGMLVLERRNLRVDVPCDAIVAVVPWRVPLPSAGLTLRLRSGQRLRQRVQPSDPAALLTALAEHGGVEDARRALRHPTVVYATAKRRPPSRWYHYAAKYPLFALLPTVVLFNAHQHIAYGALLGEYYLLGLGSWLATLTTYWTTLTIYLVLFAAVWRGIAEAVALLMAWLAPARAVRVRRQVEVGCRLLYYGGVPVLLVLRFLP